MFIDSHAHLWKDPQGLDAIAESEAIDQVWLMSISYYRDSLLKDLAGDDEVLAVSKRYPGFFVPFGCIDFDGNAEQVDRLKEAGFYGLKAIRPPLAYDHPSYFPIYERAAALQMPILFHVGIIFKNTREEMDPGRSLGPTNMRPSMLDAIAAAFPHLPLIAGHMGVPWLNELFEMLYYYPRTYCSLCGYVDYRWLIDHLDRRCGADPGVAETLCDRMMFATDLAYGRDTGLPHILRAAQFYEDFFSRVGQSYGWGAKTDTVLSGTARKIIDQVQSGAP